jgi:hypothetical protein
MPVINGVHIIDYPSIFDPELSQKVTEEGQKQLRQLRKDMRNIIEENDVKIVTAKSLNPIDKDK